MSLNLSQYQDCGSDQWPCSMRTSRTHVWTVVESFLSVGMENPRLLLRRRRRTMSVCLDGTDTSTHQCNYSSHVCHTHTPVGFSALCHHLIELQPVTNHRQNSQTDIIGFSTLLIGPAQKHDYPEDEWTVGWLAGRMTGG